MESELTETRKRGSAETRLVPVFRVWWRAVRPFSFTASITPVLVGAAVGYFEDGFHPGLLLATLVAAVAIHAGANLVNDYADHVRGVDAAQPIGPSGVIQEGILPAQAVLRGALALFGVAGGIGLWLVIVRGWPVLAAGALSVLAAYAYTGGPLPLGYLGLGDFVVFVFMGLVITVGSYYVQTGAISAAAAWAALPLAALVDAILVVNNLRDLDGDRARGKRTLATLIGPAMTRVHFAALVVGAYAAVIAGVILRYLPVTALIILVTVPRAVGVWQVVRRETAALPLTTGGIRGTAQLHQRVGWLLALALVAARGI